MFTKWVHVERDHSTSTFRCQYAVGIHLEVVIPSVVRVVCDGVCVAVLFDAVEVRLANEAFEEEEA